MKITIGTNYFNTNDRQTRAQECLRELKRRHSEISLYDVQFMDDFSGLIDDFKTLPVLTRSSRDVTDGKKKLPFVNDIFNVLSETDADYFVFTNSDILITEPLITKILSEQIKATPCNRLDIYPLKSLTSEIIPYRWEIGGFDTFVFNNNWYKANKHHFEDFLMGSVWFDHHYAGIMKKLTNDPLQNTFPPSILHEMHNKNWSFDDVESKFNAKQYENSKYKHLSKVWDDYFAQYLKNSRQNGFVLIPEDHEKLLEKDFFKT